MPLSLRVGFVLSVVLNLAGVVFLDGNGNLHLVPH
jgi:hypothetical protein